MSIRRWKSPLAASVLLCASALCQGAADFAAAPASTEVREVANWVLDAGDNQGLSFAIVDKKQARIYVFASGGRLLGASPVLLGAVRGDLSVASAPEHAPGALAPEQRTTPAGRFESQPGRNDKGEAIVWIDYNAALAIHRLRPAAALQRRPERMASANAGEHRISAGCVVVPVPFYDAVVGPSLGRHRGVVYVLPETSSAEAMLRVLEIALGES